MENANLLSADIIVKGNVSYISWDKNLVERFCGSSVSDDDGCILEKGTIKITCLNNTDSSICVNEMQNIIEDDEYAMYSYDLHDVVKFLAVDNKYRDSVNYRYVGFVDVKGIKEYLSVELKDRKIDRVILLFHGINDIDANDIANFIYDEVSVNIMFRAIEQDGNIGLSLWYS